MLTLKHLAHIRAKLEPINESTTYKTHKIHNLIKEITKRVLKYRLFGISDEILFIDRINRMYSFKEKWEACISQLYFIIVASEFITQDDSIDKKNKDVENPVFVTKIQQLLKLARQQQYPWQSDLDQEILENLCPALNKIFSTRQYTLGNLNTGAASATIEPVSAGASTDTLALQNPSTVTITPLTDPLLMLATVALDTVPASAALLPIAVGASATTSQKLAKKSTNALTYSGSDTEGSDSDCDVHSRNMLGKRPYPYEELRNGERGSKRFRF